MAMHRFGCVEIPALSTDPSCLQFLADGSDSLLTHAGFGAKNRLPLLHLYEVSLHPFPRKELNEFVRLQDLVNGLYVCLKGSTSYRSGRSCRAHKVQAKVA